MTPARLSVVRSQRSVNAPLRAASIARGERQLPRRFSRSRSTTQAFRLSEQNPEDASRTARQLVDSYLARTAVQIIRGHR